MDTVHDSTTQPPEASTIKTLTAIAAGVAGVSLLATLLFMLLYPPITSLYTAAMHVHAFLSLYLTIAIMADIIILAFCVQVISYVNEGRYREAKSYTLVPLLVSLFFNILVAIVLLVAFIKYDSLLRVEHGKA